MFHVKSGNGKKYQIFYYPNHDAIRIDTSKNTQSSTFERTMVDTIIERK